MSVAAFAILVRDTYSAVVAFVAYGLLVSLRWVLLHAVDVALTEAAIGSGLTGVLLLGAAARLRGRDGVWSLAGDAVWGGRPGAKQRADPDGILAYFARRLVPVGLLVGLYVFWVGATHPGGAFQGATIVAAMWLLAMMAGVADVPPVARPDVRAILVAGAGVFFAVGLAGLAFGDAFLAYPAAYAKALIIAIEIAMTATVAVTLTLLIAGAPERTA
ncbi:MAG: Na(+)/H(+) antiporter subunit B [Proteobacteria bacterium]|nr:Na(+)/H(+) antiporter subunit B [Pseudomonadota bacterium]